MEEEDWQSTALSNRHVHNRNSRRTNGANSKSKGLFDVRRIFGTYEVKCPAADKAAKAGDVSSPAAARLEVHGLNDDGNAVFAELILPGVLHATVIMAGSRKVMGKVVDGLNSANEVDEDIVDEKENADDEDKDESEEDNDSDESPSEDIESQRASEFEKNSFRSPKFWMKWQGRVVPSQDTDDNKGKEEILTTDMGYLVFSGNSCDKFQGTMSCAALDWKNVKIKGWKIATKPQRDFATEWHEI